MKFRLLASLLLAAVITGLYLWHAPSAGPDTASQPRPASEDPRYRITIP